MQKDARRMRDHRLFEYFKQCFPNTLDIKTNKELAYALASLPPYEVCISRIKVRHLHYEVRHMHFNVLIIFLYICTVIG